MKCVVLVVAAILASTVCAAPMNGWQRLADSDASTAETTVVVELWPAEPGLLDARFAATFDSSNASGLLRSYLDVAAIAALVRPDGARKAKLTGWLAERDLRVSDGVFGDLLLVSGSVASVERAFGVALSGYVRPPRAAVIYRSSAGDPLAALPVGVRSIVRAVHGLSDFPAAARHWSRPSGAALAGGKITCSFPGAIVDPPLLIAQYNQSGVADSSASQGVAAFEQSQFAQSDVTAFDEYYQLPVVTLRVRGPNEGGFFGESSLDTQYITASGRGVASWFLSQEQFDMLAWCESVANMSAPPAVLSVSWGSGESAYTLSSMQAASACFQKLGLMGVTLLAASGDDGTGKQGGVRNSCAQFDPTWPASSPFVTAVGATYLQLNSAQLPGVEHGWNSSGGGFSAAFAAPDWQRAAVDSYLHSGVALPESGLYAAGGRATPDVSALGTCYTVFSDGVPVGTLTGTSASTPTVAGMISMVNAQRLAAGKPTLGFINPLLYSGGDIGTDITTGYNRERGCAAGFYAAKGWDPVTGLATPWYPDLQRLLFNA